MVAPTAADASPRALASMALVVDLPWAPATASPLRPAISSASSSDRCSTGRPRRRASASSGLPASMAVETTSARASAGTASAA